MIQLLAFYLFAALVVASGLLVILARNPVHSVLWLILAFFNAAGLMILIGAEFIAMLLVIVYVGAVAVLFLFVVMMLDIDFATLRAGLVKNFPLGLSIALILLAELVLGLGANSAGVVLLVAMIGAIVLTHRDRSGTKPQNISKQVARRPEEATVNTQPEVGKGVSL
jgi:NADH-quinone oxidoreductase subunit J